MSDVIDFKTKQSEKAETEKVETLSILFKDGGTLSYDNSQYGVSVDMRDFLVINPKETPDTVLMFNTNTISAMKTELK
jgi:hypothetical protein